MVLTGCGRIGFVASEGDGGQGASDGARATIACANVIFADPFDDDTIDPVLWLVGPSSTETNGELSIVPAATNSYHGLSTVDSYDFRNRWVGVAFSGVPAAGASGAVGIRTKVGAEQDFTYAEVRDQVLRVGINTPATPNPIYQTSFDPSAHRFIRMREEGSRLYWQASETGAVWTPLVDASAPALIRNAALWGYAYDVASTWREMPITSPCAPTDELGSRDYWLIVAR